MLTSDMNKILAVLLLCFSFAFITIADPLKDPAFLALFSKASELNQLAKVWNEKCQPLPEYEEGQQVCQIVKVRISVEYGKWLKESENFVPVGDPKDCDTKIRGDIIACQRKFFIWNLKWGARELKSPDKETAAAQYAAMMIEKECVTTEIDECAKQIQSTKT